MKKIIIDPFPRKMDLIFSKEKLQKLKKKFQLIYVSKRDKDLFYEQNISKADFIIGQPYLPISILKME